MRQSPIRTLIHWAILLITVGLTMAGVAYMLDPTGLGWFVQLLLILEILVGLISTVVLVVSFPKADKDTEE